MKSTAPISSASSVTSAPACVSVEIMTTGIGRSVMILRRNVTPSMCGISTSSVMTSGLSALMRSRAIMRIGRGADHLDLGIGRQQRRQQLPHQRRIVDDQNPYRLVHVHCPLLAKQLNFASRRARRQAAWRTPVSSRATA